MKFLLHNQEATYDATAKVWKYNLDKRISNPTRLVIRKACFTCTGSTSPMPHVVYMRSKALNNMIRSKHTVELKDANHEGASDVLCVLTETHTRGRYRFTGLRSFLVDPESSVKQVDIYFTDGSTVLDGEIQAGGGGGGSGSQDDIIALHTASRLHLWLTMEKNTLLQSSYLPVDNVGDETIRYIMNRGSDCPQNIQFSTYGNVAWGVLGQTNSIYGGGTSWNNAIDSTLNPSFPDNADYQFHCLFKAPSTITGYFFMTRSIRLWFNSTTIGYTDSAGSSVYPDTITVLPNHDFLLSIARRDHPSTSVKTLYWKLKNLTLDSAVQTYEGVDAYNPYNYGETNYVISLASASTGWNMYLGPTLFVLEGDDATVTTCRNYLTNVYNGTAGGEDDSPSTAEDAGFFAELEINTS